MSAVFANSVRLTAEGRKGTQEAEGRAPSAAPLIACFQLHRPPALPRSRRVPETRSDRKPGRRLAVEGGGRLGKERRPVALLVGLERAVRQGELDVRVGELQDVGSSAVLVRDDICPDDVDPAEAGPVAARHVPVHLVHGPGEHGVAVLAVHIVRAASRVVADPDAVVLHGVAILLGDLVHRQRLASALLELQPLLHLHEVPEARLGLQKDSAREGAAAFPTATP
eukprot:scaffold1130_cov195-Pinguiococcus_pyrenoidosus.AAC.48